MLRAKVTFYSSGFQNVDLAFSLCPEIMLPGFMSTSIVNWHVETVFPSASVATYSIVWDPWVNREPEGLLPLAGDTVTDPELSRAIGSDHVTMTELVVSCT